MRFRLEIRQHVRRPSEAGSEDDQTKAQRLRNTLTPLLAQLSERQAVAGISNTSGSSRSQANDSTVDWHEIIERVNDGSPSAEPAHPAPALATSDDPSLSTVEYQTLYLPSNSNVTPSPADVELVLRRYQAQTHIGQLRDLIADKSFQYSHVIRVTPRKSIKTKGRATVKGLNAQIAFHCQVYSHCRARMVRLNADSATLKQFPALKKEDLRASTAILAPNMPGSTTLQLSWIWNDISGHILPATTADAAPAHTNAGNSATLLECTWSSLSCNIYILILFSHTRPLAPGPSTTEPLA